MTQTRRVPLLPSLVSFSQNYIFSPLSCMQCSTFLFGLPPSEKFPSKWKLDAISLPVYIPPLSFLFCQSIYLTQFSRGTFPSTTTDDIPVNAKLLSCLFASGSLSLSFSPRQLTIRGSEIDNGLEGS